jgi:hypothetical protein
MKREVCQEAPHVDGEAGLAFMNFLGAFREASRSSGGLPGRFRQDQIR